MFLEQKLQQHGFGGKRAFWPFVLLRGVVCGVRVTSSALLEGMKAMRTRQG
jgi:hypothetical protein